MEELKKELNELPDIELLQRKLSYHQIGAKDDAEVIAECALEPYSRKDTIDFILAMEAEYAGQICNALT